MKKVISSVVITLLLSIASFPLTQANAATDSDVQAKKASIEQRYGVQMTADDNFMEDPTGFMEVMKTTERAYGKFPEGLLKEITDFFKKKKITTTSHTRYYKQGDNPSLHGTFNISGSKATMTHLVEGGVLDGGLVAHELGHLVHAYLKQAYNADQLESDWTALNGSVEYREDLSYQQGAELAFAREYGAWNYSEDFATVIESLAFAPQEIRTRMLQHPDSPLARKVQLLNQVLADVTETVGAGEDPWKTVVPQLPSDWAKDTARKAFDSGLVPGEKNDESRFHTDFRGLYTANISRYDFAQLIASLIQKKTGMTLEDYVKSKGKYTKWYTESTISFDGERNVMRETTNDPFNDLGDLYVNHLYALDIVSGVKDDSVPEDGKYRRVMLTWIVEVNGLSNKQFLPDNELTREEAAALLYRTAKALELSIPPQGSHVYADADEISGWAQEAVQYATDSGAMKGIEGGRFAPQDPLTYEQAYTMLLNYLDAR